jgi:hypothetical protein
MIDLANTNSIYHKTIIMAQKPFVPAVYDSFADAIGNTPVILLKGASKRTGCKYVRTLGRSVAANLFVEVVPLIDTHTSLLAPCCCSQHTQNLREVRALESW